MNDDFFQSELPEKLDPRLANRDLEPLAPGALVKYQYISRGRNAAGNYRFVLYEDGRWFYTENSGETAAWEQPYNTPLPDQATRQMPPEVIEQTLNLLDQESFFSQSPYQVQLGPREGSFYIVTAQRDGRIHEVIYVNTSNPLVDYLHDLWQIDETTENQSVWQQIRRMFDATED